ncbi:MAG TPA: glycosyltransferase, exosortase A system-associated [Plasticicumulans sp.]|nr:glycosyltransferase, exosortase A system-associated [Plasticicumulans sp.]
MRILHVLDHSIPLHSGYTFRTRAILREQRRLGWSTGHVTGSKQVTPASPYAGPEENVDGLHFYRTPSDLRRRAGWPLFDQWAVVTGLSARLDEVIEDFRPDVLHAHSPVLNGLAALSAARRHGLPLVYEVRAFWEDAAVDHGTTREGSLRYRATRALETFVLERADAVTTICHGLRRDILGRGVPADRVTVIPNAVDVGQFGPGGQPDPALLARHGLAGKRVLGFIGSFYAYEGLDLLLEALPQIRAQAPDVQLLLVGGGPQDGALRAQAERLGLADAVHFTGRVPHAEVNAWYDLIDVLCYPRHPMRLTELVTPLKPLEAMAQGRLFVASDVGGHRELIRDGETGALFRAASAEALAERVLRLLAAPASWPKLRAAGREFVETERNWAVSVGRYRGVYARALGTGA